MILVLVVVAVAVAAAVVVVVVAARKACSRRILGRGWPSLWLCWPLLDQLGAILGAMLAVFELC